MTQHGSTQGVEEGTAALTASDRLLAICLWVGAWGVFAVLSSLGFRGLDSPEARMLVPITSSATSVVAVLVAVLRFQRWRLTGSRHELLLTISILTFGVLRLGLGTAARLAVTPATARWAITFTALALLLTFAVLMFPRPDERARRGLTPAFAAVAALACVVVVTVPGAAAAFAGQFEPGADIAATVGSQCAVAAMWLVVAYRFHRSAVDSGERSDGWCILLFIGLFQARLALGLSSWLGESFVLLAGVLRLQAVLLAAIGLTRDMHRDVMRSQLLAQRLLHERRTRDCDEQERRHDVQAAIFAIHGGAAALGSQNGKLDANDVAALATALSAEASRLQRLVSGHRDEDDNAAAFTMRELLTPVVLVERARGLRIKLDGWLDAPVRGSQDAAREIVRNLLDNARLHAPGAHVTIAVRTAPVEQLVLLTVADDGPGVRAADRDRIFERGVRADFDVDGSGLGLYVAAKLAGEHGGDLWLEQTDGPGAAFTLCLPAACTAASTAQSASGTAVSA